MCHCKGEARHDTSFEDFFKIFYFYGGMVLSGDVMQFQVLQILYI